MRPKGHTSMKLNYISLVLSIFASQCSIIEGFSINLVGSSLRYAGRIEIKTDSNWSSICDVGWNMKNAHVVCRELGYIEAEAAILGEAFGPAPGQIRTKQFRCYGNERSLWECPSNESISTSCSKRTVAAVLCTPSNFFFQIFIFSGVVCLAITSIIIFIVTCRTMHLRRLIEKLKSSRNLPAANSEIGVSNLNNEEIIKADEWKSDQSSKTLANGGPSNAEYKEPSQEDNNLVYKRETTLSTTSDPELIISCEKEDHHAHDDKRHVGKYKGSHKKSRYMRLKRTSVALIHFYTKLLEKNRNRKPTTAVDYPDDFYSFSENDKDLTMGSIPDINDVTSTSTGEYNEIYSDSEENENNGDKEGYVSMDSMCYTLEMNRGAAEVQNPLQDEYLDILPPTHLSKANNSRNSGKRNSDYLDPVETNLPFYPETFDKSSSSSYNDELPDPPKECGAFLGNSLGLDNTECWCNNDLICSKCLNNNNNNIEKKEKSDENSVYLQMENCSTGSNKTDVQENIRVNSVGYAMPLKKSKKDHEEFSEGLKKTLSKQNIALTLPQSVNTKLKPNEREDYDYSIESSEEEVAKEKGNNDLSTPNEKNIQKSRFSANKDYFENQAANKVEKACSLTRLLDPKEAKPNMKTALQSFGIDSGGKLRSESCPVELAGTSTSPKLLFMQSLENALKSNAIRDKRELEKKSLADETPRENQMESKSENDYELDYENILSPKILHYENNDLYLNKGTGYTGSRSDSDECEYENVNERQRISSHFYEAVAKDSDEDQYENI